MEVSRRQVLGGGGAGLLTLLLGGGAEYLTSGDDSETSSSQESGLKNPEDIDPKLMNASRLGLALHERLEGTLPDLMLYVVAGPESASGEPELAVRYETRADSPDEVEAELHNVAKTYGDVLHGQEENPVTLTATTSQVSAMVPKPVAVAYDEGRINQEAYLETVEIMETNEHNSTGG
jgi:hypothetical protein